MKHPGTININEYTYDLPVDKIAFRPLPQRDASRLLIYKNGEIKEATYFNIDQYLPENSLLIFNNTKVINARLRFKKNTGAPIEIFCLEPAEMKNEYSGIMAKRERVRWKCLVGGAAKWKDELLKKSFIINDEQIVLKATLIEKINDIYTIELSWTPEDLSFAEILEAAGEVPLPPYIKREPVTEDKERYQTIYAEYEGSVAAPTAGLHFTRDLLKKLSKKNIRKDFITLHVGAGTFKPVKADNMHQHEMHEEWIDVTIQTLKVIAAGNSSIIAVGTTSLRTIETLYWLGVKIILDPEIKDLHLSQWNVYEKKLSQAGILPTNALLTLVKWMEEKNLKRIFTKTQLLIAPGYEFKIVTGLITNFHQPRSTLLLLVAAAVGNDWKRIYDHALENDFRFLSYGDGNLIFIN